MAAISSAPDPKSMATCRHAGASAEQDPDPRQRDHGDKTARALPVGRDDLLAGQYAGGKRQEQ